MSHMKNLKYLLGQYWFPIEGGTRQNRLHLESRTPSWVRLWTLSYMPSPMETAYQLENQTPGWKTSSART